MKRLYIYIIGITLLLTSCHLVTSNNGELDGLWQGMMKEDLATGEVVDLRDSQATWAFQGGMVEMNATTIPPNHVIGKFERGDKTLRVYHLALFTHGKGDTPLEDVTMLKVFGFTTLDETFRIIELNDDALRVETDNVRLTFRKY